jgi:hypothetical protein
VRPWKRHDRLRDRIRVGRPAVNPDRLTAIVELALDDLAEGHVDLPTALRLVATAGWHEGHNDYLNDDLRPAMTGRSLAG